MVARASTSAEKPEATNAGLRKEICIGGLWVGMGRSRGSMLGIRRRWVDEIPSSGLTVLEDATKRYREGPLRSSSR